MIKKFLLVISLLFFIFVFAAPKSFASFNCDYIFANPIIAGTNETINLTINSHSKLAANTKYYLVITDGGLIFNAPRPRSALLLIPVTTDVNRNIIFNNTYSNIDAGSFRIKVDDIASGITQCNEQTYVVKAPSAGEKCTVTVTSTNNIPKITGSNFNNISNDSLKVELKDSSGNNVNFSSGGNQCFSKSTLSSGIVGSSALSSGNYTAAIMDGCLIYSPACSTPFNIDTSGGGGGGSSTNECYICNQGFTYHSGTPPTCTSSSTTVNATFVGLCDACDPNHLLGCTSQGSITNGFTSNTNPYNSNQTPPLQCAAPPDANGNCPKVSSALGIDINTDAAGFIKTVFSVVLSLVGFIAVLLMIISGYRLMVSQGNPEKLQGAREQLTAAIIGLLFVIFSFVFLQIIGVNILGLPGFSG